MIIWGSRGREIEISSGQFHCPNCDTARPYRHKRVAKYFTLYFIPLFQTENLGEYIECQVCLQTYKPEVLNYEPPSAAERLLVAVRRELESGMPLHMLQKKLEGLGINGEDSVQLVNAATGSSQKTCANCGFKYLGNITLCSNCGSSLPEISDSQYALGDGTARPHVDSIDDVN